VRSFRDRVYYLEYILNDYVCNKQPNALFLTDIEDRT
jgi:hypothetical protein